MTDTPHEEHEEHEEHVDPEELETADGEPLPDREAMSTIPLGDPIGGFTAGPIEP